MIDPIYEEEIQSEEEYLRRKSLLDNGEMTITHKIEVEGLWVAVAILAVGIVVAFNTAGLATLCT